MQDQVTIYYNADDPVSRTLMGYARSLDIPILAFDIRKKPFTPMQLLHMASKLGMPVDEMVCRNRMRRKFREPKSLSAEDWAVLLQKQPELLKKPIAIRRNKVALLHTANEILQL